MHYLFTSESVSEGHPDKVADQISDAILDEFLRQDPEAKVACETFCTTGLVVVGGEVTSDSAYVDIQKTVRRVIREIGYDKAEYQFDCNSCGVLSAIHEQSADIFRGVERTDGEQGAGDQGMMFGYACSETSEYMPLPLYLSHLTLKILADIRKKEPSLMPYLRPDAKAQFTVEYDAETRRPVRIHTIVLSTQHDEFTPGYGSYAEAVSAIGEAAADRLMHDAIEDDVRNILIPNLISHLPEESAALFDGKFILHVNPTGKFVIGGPSGDTGLTGRKIIVDTYGTAAPEVAALAGGKALADGFIASKIASLFDLRPAAITERFGLKNPIYAPTAAYGHMGRTPYRKTLRLQRNGRSEDINVQFFGWELLDSVDPIKKAFGL